MNGMRIYCEDDEMEPWDLPFHENKKLKCKDCRFNQELYNCDLHGFAFDDTVDETLRACENFKPKKKSVAKKDIGGRR